MKVGELLMLSIEWYSDQHHVGPFLVMKDFSVNEIADKVAKMPPMDGNLKNGPDNVIDLLVKEGFIKETACKKFHLGSYGQIQVSGDKDE